MTCVQSGWGEGTCPDCNKPPNDHFMCPDCIVTCFCGRKKCGIYCRFNIHTQSSINKPIIQEINPLPTHSSQITLDHFKPVDDCKLPPKTHWFDIDVDDEIKAVKFYNNKRILIKNTFAKKFKKNIEHIFVNNTYTADYFFEFFNKQKNIIQFIDKTKEDLFFNISVDLNCTWNIIMQNQQIKYIRYDKESFDKIDFNSMFRDNINQYFHIMNHNVNYFFKIHNHNTITFIDTNKENMFICEYTVL